MNKFSFALACLASIALAAPASARRAPIEYAGGQGTSQSPPDSNQLVGGGQGSYGYGGANSSQGDGVVIDLRHNAPSQVQAVSAPPPPLVALPPVVASTSAAAPSSQTRPAWLENERVGPPYQANGRWYVPAAEPGYEATGTASWYGPTFHGGRTASGEIYDQEAITAAHPTLPIPSLVQVTNLDNGREVIVRVNDRGPFVGDRVLDLSHGAALVLGVERAGTARVHIRYLGPAPRHFDDVLPAAPGPASAPSALSPAPAQSAEEGPASLLPPPANAADAVPASSAVQQAAYQPPAPAASAPYFVQVGAFSDVDNAHRVQAAVSSAGPVAVDVRRSSSGAELFRVRVGPFGSRQEADAARQNVAALGYGESVVAAP